MFTEKEKLQLNIELTNTKLLLLNNEMLSYLIASLTKNEEAIFEYYKQCSVLKSEHLASLDSFEGLALLKS
jgi:hypothetical protein